MTPRDPRRVTAGDLTALYLLGSDPLLELPGRGQWDEALEGATTVIAHASVMTEGLREHATVVFPAESYAEKEGFHGSPPPTAASSACVRRSGARARCGPSGR